MINNNYSKQEDNKINYCRICAKNGFPSERIIFRGEGTKSDGSILWVLYDYSRPMERHIHKPILQDGKNDTTVRTQEKNDSQIQFIDTIGPVVAKNLSLSQENNELLHRLIDMLEKIAKEKW